MLAVIFRIRYLVNTTHKAKCKNGAVRLKSRRKFRGVQLASAGYYLSRRTIKVFEPLRPLYQATHLLKITAHLLLTHYSISKSSLYFKNKNHISLSIKFLKAIIQSVWNHQQGGTSNESIRK